MTLVFVTNIAKDVVYRFPKYRSLIQGEPRAGADISVANLKELGWIGLYKEMDCELSAGGESVSEYGRDEEARSCPTQGVEGGSLDGDGHPQREGCEGQGDSDRQVD